VAGGGLYPYQVFVSPTDAWSCLYQLPAHNTRTAFCYRPFLPKLPYVRHAQRRVTAAPHVTVY